MFLSPDFERYAMLSPLVFFLVNLWAGSAVATYQDLVLPRMYGTIGAVYLLGSTMVGLAIGPYVTGKVATISGSLFSGVMMLTLAAPIAVLSLWLLSRCIQDAERTKIDRAAKAEGMILSRQS
jgi:MFS family permease